MNNKFRKEGMNSCNCSKRCGKETDSTISGNRKRDVLVPVQFAAFLCSSNQFDKFENWFRDLSVFSPSLLDELKKNEEFCLCVARLRFSQKKYQEVIEMLKSAPFSAKEEYVTLWENAHYKQKEENIGKCLTPLQRFRLRKKYPPPTNICPFGRQIISPLFKEASVILKRWYNEHMSNPYPNMNEKKVLSLLTGLTLYQVKTWFANTRRRRKVRQMQLNPPCHQLNNKAHSMADSTWLDKNSSESLDLSIVNLEKRADLEDTGTVDMTGSDAVCLLEEADPDLREPHVELEECENSTKPVIINKSTELLNYPSSLKVDLVPNDDSPKNLQILSSAPNFFLTSMTNATEMPPNLGCPNSSIYSFPVYTTPIEPSTSLGAWRPDHSNQIDQGTQTAKLQDANSNMRRTQEASYLVAQNPTPVCTADYSLVTLPCPTVDTSNFVVVCSLPIMPNNDNLVPLLDNHLQPISASSNSQNLSMDDGNFNQLTRSCDSSITTNHETASVGNSTLNPPHSNSKDFMDTENEIAAHMLLRLSREGKSDPY